MIGDAIQHHQACTNPDHNSEKAASWHPADCHDISPLKTQLLYACTVNNISLKHIPLLAQNLSVHAQTVEHILHELVATKMLLHCTTLTLDRFSPTSSGLDVLYKIAARKPEFLALTKILLINNKVSAYHHRAFV
ncbi:MAG: hypothetical protein ACOYK8_05615 [Alphaproteobacteria bacterium]